VALPDVDWLAIALQLLSWAGPAAFALAVRLWRQGAAALATFREAMAGVAVLLNRDRRELDLLRRVVYHVSRQEFARLSERDRANLDELLAKGMERHLALDVVSPFLAEVEKILEEINGLRDTAWRADVFKSDRLSRKLKAWAGGRIYPVEPAMDHGNTDTSACDVIDREAKKA